MIDKDLLRKQMKNMNIKTTNDLQGVFRGLMKQMIELLYEEEMEDHLGYERHEQHQGGRENHRNGHSKKTVESQHGPVDLEVPRDRSGTFDPVVIGKYQKDITGIEEKVISMYAKGMSTRDISAHIQDIYGVALSAESISRITDRVNEQVTEWQSRPLKGLYPIVYMDGVVVKMRKDGVVRKMCVYGVIGIDLDGNKDVLGLYVSETESAKYWLTVMSELRNRGLQDVLIFCVDNLTGISSAIESVYPQATVQKCVVHQIRNSLKYVSWKERKEVAADLKPIYRASNEEQGKLALLGFAEKWDKKYPHIAKSWTDNWAELSPFFSFTPEIRKLIYTTNPIESFNRALRKVSKNRAIFPTEEALLKLLYLAVQDMTKKWTMRIHDWGTIYSQLFIHFEERITPHMENN